MIHQNKAMKITVITEKVSGCYKYRTQIPAKYLRKLGHQVYEMENVKVFAKAPLPDVVVFARGYHLPIENPLKEIADFIQLLRKAKIKTVYETDDAIDKVPPWNPFRDTPETMASSIMIARETDLTTTTTVTLAKYLSKWSKQAVVLPNSLDPDEWRLRDFGNKKLRIGWSGSASHFRDLSLVLDIIRDLQKIHGFTFIIQGITDEPDLVKWHERQRERLGKAFDISPLGKAVNECMRKLGQIDYEFVPFAPICDHAEKLRSLNLDIGIAPLEVDEFNNKKSCLKFYEYAAVGTVTLASKALPYSEELQFTAKNNYRDWRDKLGMLIRNFGEELYKPQREWVFEHRNAATNVMLWEKSYAMLYNKKQ